jgi:hypothetical protein
MLAELFFNLRPAGFNVTAIFWGLWLFPLGLLVYRSGFFRAFFGGVADDRHVCLPTQ